MGVTPCLLLPVTLLVAGCAGGGGGGCRAAHAAYLDLRAEARTASPVMPPDVIDGVDPRSALKIRAARLVNKNEGCFAEVDRRFAEQVLEHGLPG